MSMINNTSIEGNTINGCSLWQLGTEFQLHQAVGARDDYQRWRSAASRGVAYADVDDDDDAQCRRFHFSNMSLKFSEMKIQHPDKWYKTLPPAEMLPRNEVLGGFIFVCNNETMQEDLHRQLFGNLSSTLKLFDTPSLFGPVISVRFNSNKIAESAPFERFQIAVKESFLIARPILFAGLPQKYKDSVRAITPGLPLFLYNYTAHQLHGVFQVCFISCSQPFAWPLKKLFKNIN